MFISIICPVRNALAAQRQAVEDYVAKLELEGHKVHHPPRDVNQTDATGLQICQEHLAAMKHADEIHIFWDKTSSGSHFDLGMAFALEKTVRLIQAFHPDSTGKSYHKVIQEIAKQETE